MRIAIDVGGVLTQYDGAEARENMVINVDGAIEGLEQLKESGFNIFIVSYCKEKSAIFRTNKLKSDFQDIYFDFEYYTTSKLKKCDIINWIQADIMIDDNEQILNNIKESNKDVITILYQEFCKVKKGNHKKHLLADNWAELIELISNIKNIQPKNFIELPKYYNIKNLHDKAIFLEDTNE